jgi:hypothetical protein
LLKGGSGSAWWPARRTINRVDDAHVYDTFGTIGGKCHFAAYLLDERTQLTSVGGVTCNCLLRDSIASLKCF